MDMEQRLPDREPELHQEDEKPVYEPRPKWQLALAWILVFVMLIGIFGTYYWMIRGV